MEYLKLGKISKPHGLKGEVKIFSTTDFADIRYKKGNVVFLLSNNEYIPLKVHSYYKYNMFDVVSFEDYLDINLVNPLLNKKVYIKKEDATLPKGYYHNVDLIGLDIISDNKIIGKVINVLNLPANDIIRAKDSEGKTFDIPFVDEYVLNIDLDKKQIHINLIEGML